MDCHHIREAISARLDDEDPGLPVDVIDAHLDGCRECTSWAADSAALHRASRVRPAEPVPDLTAAIISSFPAAEPSRAARGATPRWAAAWREPISAWRWALFAIALTQLVLGVPSVLFGQDPGATVHIARELGAFDVALAVGLLVAAWQPARAWGLLPVVGALGVALGGTAVLDIADGSVSSLNEARHLLDLAAVPLLWLVARDARSDRPPVGSTQVAPA